MISDIILHVLQIDKKEVKIVGTRNKNVSWKRYTYIVKQQSEN